ncbi:LytTR family DNA-binding domain-containing protein [Chishuiella sp.]|uniref:LytR/AlgR family response regulator transcription factor n=1 Tax=Chishuiella sp. TaxID=1969467 RepID=UPI0028A880FB|nr:LytTR family DNA-binding domain-containing protein [Chishuiella sp.]
MKVAIVEDELLAANYLKQLLEQQNIINIDYIKVLRSKQEAVLFFSDNNVDLIFMDIQLGDGNSLEIFEKVEIKNPIVFVTAYDEYALKVFKHFTIDYILKPFENDEVLSALTKYKSISTSFDITSTLDSLVSIENQTKSKVLNKIMVSNGNKLIVLEEEEIAYFFASGKHLFITTIDNRTYIYNDNLKDIIDKLNSNVFFKINRKYIVSKEAIKEVIKHSSQKIEIILNPLPEIKTEILISKMQISEWKKWMEK